MAERPAESKWLYNQPSDGVVAAWFQRNQGLVKDGFIDPKILDGGFILASTVEEMDGTPNFRYKADQIAVGRNHLEMPRINSGLWDRFQKHKDAMAARNETDGAKYSVRRFSPFLTDRGLQIEFSDFSWSGMELNNDVNRGDLPESLRDTILPTLSPNGYVFDGPLPNNAVVQGIIVTKDRHLVLTTRAVNAQYYQGTVSPSFEEQMNRAQDETPHQTFLRAVSYSPKLKLRGEELRLSVQPENIRLVSLVLEPQFNAVGFVMLGVCDEESGEIDETKFGVDRAEFNPTKPIWTMSLEDPTKLIEAFYNPSGFRWHGIGRERVVSALASVQGYEEALNLLYKAKPF